MQDTCEMSHRNHLGVLLQHAQYQYLYTSVCYTNLRYTYRSHFGDYFRDIIRFMGIASYLPRLSTFEDYLQG